ncbi:MAG: hypothetical protein PHH11_08940 [Methylomonas sp.]|nr:hypothetical protein [Methylomonas sp.]
MENLQKLMPYFQDQLLQWYRLTLERPDYAVAVAFSVWLLMAVFYSIRIAFLKKDIAKLAKANADIQAGLDDAQKQNQTQQQQLTEVSEQLQNAVQLAEAEMQRANTAEQRLNASNQELAAGLANLVESFELTLHNLPSANSDNLIPEYQSVIGRVAERFKNEQQAKTQLQLSFHAESAKLAEKEMLITSLQHRLDSQTQQLAQMELAIEQYEAAQRQLQVDREQQLAEAMAKQQAETAKLAELKIKEQQAKQTQAAVVSIESAVEKTVPPVKPAEMPVKPVETAPFIDSKPEPIKARTVPVDKPAATISTPVVATEKGTKAAEDSKFKGLFGRAMEKFSKMDEKLGSPRAVKVDHEPENAIEEVKAVEAEPIRVVQAEEKPAELKQEPKAAAGVAAKMGGLFGGFKKSQHKQVVVDISTSPIEVKIEEPIPEPEIPVAVDEAVESGKKMPSQLTGLFGKFKKK